MQNTLFIYVFIAFNKAYLMMRYQDGSELVEMRTDFTYTNASLFQVMINVFTTLNQAGLSIRPSSVVMNIDTQNPNKSSINQFVNKYGSRIGYGGLPIEMKVSNIGSLAVEQDEWDAKFEHRVAV